MHRKQSPTKKYAMEQSRKKFLKQFFIGAASVPMIIEACKKTNVISDTTETGSGNSGGSSSGTCVVSPTETEGPYPTHSPSSYVRSDIRDDRTGVTLAVKVTIKDTNNSCAALANAVVDIWHCDKDGNYSEYSSGFTGVHFLRGRQTTDSNGLVTFTSIFPGWYTGRATHIHVHIYNFAGTSLLVTQIAFPEGSSSAVATVNGSGGVSYGYTKGMSGYTYNANDNVFSDDSSGIEIATLTGSLSAGYELTHNISVAA